MIVIEILTAKLAVLTPNFVVLDLVVLDLSLFLPDVNLTIT